MAACRSGHGEYCVHKKMAACHSYSHVFLHEAAVVQNKRSQGTLFTHKKMAAAASHVF